MNNFSYTKSPALLSTLQRIEELRKKHLLTLLPPARELQLQWDAMKERYHYMLLSYGVVLSEKSLENLFMIHSKQKQSAIRARVKRYKTVYDYIIQNWSINLAPLEIDHARHIFALSGFHKRLDLIGLDRYLRYVQAPGEHPLIQTALIYPMFLSLSTTNEESNTVAHHLCMLFLVKHGYDIKRLVVHEHVASIKEYSRSHNINYWLEYFLERYYSELKEIGKNMHRVGERDIFSSWAQLSPRQKEILTLIDRPKMKITNKMVQKKFNVSAITASRDLTKLAELCLLLKAGNGRSVYYTKG